MSSCLEFYSKVYRFLWSQCTFNVPAELIYVKITETTRFSNELFCLKEEEEEEEEFDVRGAAGLNDSCIRSGHGSHGIFKRTNI